MNSQPNLKLEVVMLTHKISFPQVQLAKLNILINFLLNLLSKLLKTCQLKQYSSKDMIPQLIHFTEKVVKTKNQLIESLLFP